MQYRMVITPKRPTQAASEGSHGASQTWGRLCCWWIDTVNEGDELHAVSSIARTQFSTGGSNHSRKGKKRIGPQCVLHRTSLAVESVGTVGDAAHLQDIRLRMRSNLEASIPLPLKGFGNTIQTVDLADNVSCHGCVDVGSRSVENREIHRYSAIWIRRHRIARLVASCSVDQGSS